MTRIRRNALHVLLALVALPVVTGLVNAAPAPVVVTTEDAAGTRALQFLTAIGSAPADPNAAVQFGLAEGRANLPPWPSCPDCWHVAFKSGEQLSIRQGDGQVVDFSSLRLSSSWYKEKVTNPISREAALAAAESVLAASGNSGETFLSPTLEFDRPGGNFPEVGFWFISWKRTYQGIPFDNDGVNVSLEANAGLPMGLSKKLDIPLPASSTVSVSQVEAVQIARKQLSGALGFTGAVFAAQLEIVLPNDDWGNTADASASRVAWALEFDSRWFSVFVDAATGEILGGHKVRILVPDSPGARFTAARVWALYHPLEVGVVLGLVVSAFVMPLMIARRRRRAGHPPPATP